MVRFTARRPRHKVPSKKKSAIISAYSCHKNLLLPIRTSLCDHSIIDHGSQTYDVPWTYTSDLLLGPEKSRKRILYKRLSIDFFRGRGAFPYRENGPQNADGKLFTVSQIGAYVTHSTFVDKLWRISSPKNT